LAVAAVDAQDLAVADRVQSEVGVGGIAGVVLEDGLDVLGVRARRSAREGSAERREESVRGR
jgi:hypothetical protein